MADFNHYAPLLRSLEGGFVADPDDRGGATMCGVTLSTYRRYFGEGRTVDDLRNITPSEWTYIMKSGYWDLVRADEIHNQSIAEIFVDWVVNSGVAGIRAFQRAAGLKVDGIVGNRTLAVLNSPNEEVIFNRVQSVRESFYRKIVLNDARQGKFLNGWLRRLRTFKFSAE